MACLSARPTAMLPPLQASRLACSLRRQGSLLARAFCSMAAADATPQRQQQVAAAAAPAGLGLAADEAARHPLERLSIVATNPTATQLLAHFFACELHPADCYLLYGSVGAGKSYFSRAFIRAAADDEELPVPSPTFLLQNMYTDHQGPPIHHFDLYRLTQRYDLARLDLPASFSQAVCLVEWAERLEGSEHLPADHLAVHVSIMEGGEQARLQQALEQQRQMQRQRQQQQHSSGDSAVEGGLASTSSSSSSSSEEQEEEEQEEEGEGDEEGSGDLRWRRFQLAPAAARWQPRLQLLRRYLAAEGAQVGCHLFERREVEEAQLATGNSPQSAA